MPVHDSPAERGARRGRLLTNRIATDLESARIAAGLSIRELARQLGVDRERIKRVLHAEANALTLDLGARVAAVLGLELSALLHHEGAPVRDKGHLALLERLRARLSLALRWRTEVPIPIAGDRRSGDAVISGSDFEIHVEAETHLGDIQALERAIAAKQRDLGIDRVILLVADTRHNREVVKRVEELRRRFPVTTRACLIALAAGRDPGGDALVII